MNNTLLFEKLKHLLSWFFLLVILLLSSNISGQITINSSTSSYSQNFDGLAATTATNIVWSNNTTLSGWYLFNGSNTAITTYSAETGSTGTATYSSYGATNGGTERALGSIGSGGAYWGSPASGNVGGYMAVAFLNSSGTTINNVSVSFDGEQWRNGGNATAQTMTLQYGFGSTFAGVSTWVTPGGNFNFTSPVATATAAAVNGNVAGKAAGLGGSLSSLGWANNATLWIRWVEVNDTGNDHALGIDNFSFTATIINSTITGAVTSSTPFTTTYGTASASQSFAVSGSGLTNPLVATAPTGFEVSRNDVVSYGATASYTAAEANAGGISFLVRLKNNANVGNYNGQNIVLSSSPATSVNISTSASGNTVSALGLTITGLTANNKTFDGTTTATLSGTPVLNTVLFSDDVVLGGTPIANFSDASVGNGKTVTVTGYAISGTKAGNYSLSQPSGLTANIEPSSLLDQTITFGSLTPVTYGDADFQLNATTDNPGGEPIVYTSSNTAVATVTGDVVTIVGAGTTTITASQAGSATHNPAVPIARTLTVNTIALTVTGLTAVDKVYNGNTTATLTGTAALSPSPIVGDDVVLSGTPTANFASANVGTHAVTVSGYSLTGTDAANYSLSQPSGLSASISQASQTITFNALPALTTLTAPINLSTFATSTSGLPVTFSSSNTSVATISGTTLTIVGGGSVTITASQAGDTNYAAATPVNQLREVISVLYLNQFTGTAACPTQGNVPTVQSNMTGAALTRNTVTCSSLANFFNSTTLNNTASINNNSYIEFSVTAAAGYRFNLSSVSFFRQASASAPNQLEVRYSTDGFATSTTWGAAPVTPTTGTVLTWDFADFVSPMAGTVTFRVYPYGTQRADLTGTSASAGTFRVDDVTIFGTVVAAPPVVTTTSPAASITTTSATLSGNVTSVGGSAITGNGVVVALTATNANPTIGGAGVTNEVNSGFSAGTGVFSVTTATALASNKQYSFRAYASNANGTSYGNAVTFFTLAQAPTNAVVISNPQTTSLDLDLSNAVTPNTNTQFAIRAQVGSTTYYVQADGTLGVSEFWQYENGASLSPKWPASITVTNLSSNTLYTFDVKARNGANVETAFGPSAQESTLVNVFPTLEADPVVLTMGNVCINTTSTFNGEFALLGVNLTSQDVTVGPLEGYTFSTSASGPFTATLSLTPNVSGEVLETIYVKLSPTAVQAYNGNIAVSGGGATTVNVAVTGAGVNTLAVVSNSPASSITATTATLNGSFTAGCPATIEYGFQYSLTNDFAVFQTVSGIPAAVSGLAPNTQYFYRLYYTDGNGTTYATPSSFTTLGISAPVATAATSVGANNFTANWNAVPGASNYRLDVATNALFSVNNTLTEGFEGTTFPPTGFITTGWARSTTAADVKTGVASAVANTANGSLTTPAIAYPTSVSFALGRSTNTTAKTLDVQVSTTSQTTGFTTVATYDHSNVPSASYNTYTVDLSAYSNEPIVYVRFSKTSVTTSPWRFDDLAITSLVNYTLPGYSNKLVNGTSEVVTGLQDNTTYYYRVRAVSANSLSANSNTQSVTTIVSPPTFTSVFQSANVVCENTAATFNVLGLVPNSTSTISYTINGGAVQTATNVVANAGGFATFNVTLPLTANGQLLAITQIERTDLTTTVLTLSSGNTAVISISANVTYYADADGDGYGNAAISIVSCNGVPVVFGNPAVLDNTDCDDSDNTKHTTFSFYVDTDGDGVGSGSLVNGICAVDANTPPTGYSLTNTDCSPNDATAYREGTFYADADGDNYSVNNDTFNFCYGAAEPVGYSLLNLGVDCDDTIFAVNPGVTEILYNGVDDNCNGVMDEGYQITANMVNCGTTLSTLSSFIYCVSTPGVNGYRFEVTNTTTNQVQTIDRPIQYFSLTQLSSYDYATTYSVRVMVRKSSNNVWLGYYGPACLYSTPPVVAPTGGAGTTQLQTYCGETLPTISTIISTTSLAGATGYRFRVTNTTTGAVQTLTRTLHWFSLTMLSSYNYGTTYAVDVAVKTTGDYSNYGAPCFVTTPAVPTLSNYCGGAVVPTKGTLIRTTSLDKVTAYEFTVDRYNASLELVSSSVVVKSLNRFTFNDITNYAPNTTYSVRVRVFTAGSWSPYGDACEIVSPGAAKQGDTKAVDSSLFSVVAYPNPYDYQFSFRMESSSDAPVHVKVYDMIGKLIETREINAADMPVVSLGERYPSGVYNVVVTQEDNVKTLRLVKR